MTDAAQRGVPTGAVRLARRPQGAARCGLERPGRVAKANEDLVVTVGGSTRIFLDVMRVFLAIKSATPQGSFVLDSCSFVPGVR